VVKISGKTWDKHDLGFQKNSPYFDWRLKKFTRPKK